MHAARVDAERPRRHIFVVLRFGVRKEGEGAGVAHQHPLPPLHEGQRIDADAVPEAHGLHFGNGRLVQRQRALRQFQLRYDVLEACQRFGKHHHDGHAAFENPRRKAGFGQRSDLDRELSGHGGLREQIFHRDDLPPLSQYEPLAPGDAGGDGFFLGLGAEPHGRHVRLGPHVAQGQGADALHMFGFGDDPVDAGFEGQRHVFLAERHALEINVRHGPVPVVSTASGFMS